MSLIHRSIGQRLKSKYGNNPQQPPEGGFFMSGDNS